MVTLQSLDKQEIKLITLMINSVRDGFDCLEGYYYGKQELSDLIKISDLNESVIRELEFYGVLCKDTHKYCSNCTEADNICNCEEPSFYEEDYYKVNVDIFIEYFKKTFSNIYNVDLLEDFSSDYKKIYVVKEYDVKLEVYLKLLEEDYVSSISSKDKIIISIMPLNQNSREKGIYEWHELLDSITVDELKIKIKDISKNNKSEDFYYFDLGDDLEVGEVERIRTVLSKYFELKDYKEYTDNKSYKPEYIDYGIPIDKIKACFIKDGSKILVLKPNDKQIKIAYFNNGMIGQDNDIYEKIRRFDNFIKKKVIKYRKIKSLEVKSDKTQKVIQLVGPIINICAVLYTFINNKEILAWIVNLVSGYKSLVIYMYIILNIISIAFIVIFSILPYLRRIFFSWERNLKKL